MQWHQVWLEQYFNTAIIAIDPRIVSWKFQKRKYYSRKFSNILHGRFSANRENITHSKFGHVLRLTRCLWRFFLFSVFLSWKRYKWVIVNIFTIKIFLMRDVFPWKLDIPQNYTKNKKLLNQTNIIPKNTNQFRRNYEIMW